MSYELIKGYHSGEICGWGEVRHPGIAAEFIRRFTNEGIIYPFQLSGKRDNYSRPEYFSLHRVARKLLGRDIGGGVQAIGDCVSWGARHATEYSSVCNIVVRNKSEKFRPIFPPYYYGTGRTYIGGGRLGNGDGSLGSWMAQAVEKYGTLFADESGVPQYSGQIAKRWGDPNPSDDLDKWRPTAEKYKVRACGQITSWDAFCDAIANGYGVAIASNQGFQMEPGPDGYHDASGNWAHQLGAYGYGPDYALIVNSWGDVHGHLKDFHEGDNLPVATIRARKATFERMIDAGECFAYTQLDGYPEQIEELQKALFDLIGN